MSLVVPSWRKIISKTNNHYSKQMVVFTQALYFVLSSSRSQVKVSTAGDFKKPERKGLALGTLSLGDFEPRGLWAHFETALAFPHSILHTCGKTERSMNRLNRLAKPVHKKPFTWTALSSGSQVSNFRLNFIVVLPPLSPRDISS